MKSNTVHDLVKYDLCFSCGTCSASCNRDAINMELIKEKGLIYPNIDQRKCVNCGICLKVCPINNMQVGEADHLVSNNEEILLLQSTNQEDVYKSTSGGAVRALLKYMFERGDINKAIVAGIDHQCCTKTKGYIVESLQELNKLSSSIYQPVALNEVLKQVQNSDRVAFVGLPCHIRGLVNFQSINPKLKDTIYIKIGLICTIGRGRNGTKYVLDKFTNKKENILGLTYRQGAYPGFMMITTNKNIHKIQKDNYLSYIDFLYLPKGCLFCNDLFNDLADISVGDPWGIEKDKKTMTIIKNYKGKSLLDYAIKEKYLNKFGSISREDAIKTQQHGVVYKIHNYNKRVYLYKKLGVKIPDNIDCHKENMGLKSSLGYFMLLLNARFFNSKGYRIVGAVCPDKILKKYRHIVANLVCK